MEVNKDIENEKKNLDGTKENLDDESELTVEELQEVILRRKKNLKK